MYKQDALSYNIKFVWINITTHAAYMSGKKSPWSLQPFLVYSPFSSGQQLSTLILKREKTVRKNNRNSLQLSIAILTFLV